MTLLLRIRDLTVALPPHRARRPLVARVRLNVGRGEIVGLVGESGSGKTTTARAAIGLFPRDARVSGKVEVDGEDLLSMAPEDFRRIRSERVAMIFQDPRASINPLRRVGEFLTEPLVFNLGWSRDRAERRAVELLKAAGLDDPDMRLRQYPYELSGGMLQRVAIAGALIGDPELLLADEATSSVDVTTQAEILSTLTQLQRERDLGLVFITHNLHLAAAFCHRIYVMYAGRIVEAQPASTLFVTPRHPYTAALLRSSPALDMAGDIHPIPGRPPSLDHDFSGCPYAERCSYAEDRCRDGDPGFRRVGAGWTACIRSDEISDHLQAEGIASARQAGSA